MTGQLLLAVLTGFIGGATATWLRRRRPVKVTRLLPLPETKPGRIHTDPNGKEWVALQTRYDRGNDDGGVLTVTYAEGGTPADPRIKYRLDLEGA